MKKQDYILSAVLTILLGILFIVLKGEVISIAMTVLGAALVIYGIIDLVHQLTLLGIIKIVIGALIIVFGWVLVSAMLYVLGALLLIYGIYGLYALFKTHTRTSNVLATIFLYAVPVLYIVIACLLFFNQGGTIAWVFIVSGVLLIIEGIINLVDALKK